MFLKSFSKLELCILQHNVSLGSFPEFNDGSPPSRYRERYKRVKWRPLKIGETE